jgi:hypothetical protein
MYGNLDSKTIPDSDIAGLSWHVTVDEDTFYYGDKPDGDCYTPKQVAAFQAGDWSYVTVGVTPVVAGVELDGCDEYLSGVEYGTYTCTDEDDNVTGVVRIDLDKMIHGSGEDYEPYPVPDLILEAKTRLAGMAPVFAEVFGQVKAGVTPRELVSA